VTEKPSPKRTYRMGARAEAAAATRERILETAGKLFSRSVGESSSLEDVAQGAETTVQTVLRHFGSKDGLIDAILQSISEPVRRERAKVTPGDVPAAVVNLVKHYERYGNLVLRVLAEEHRRPLVLKATDHGRELHRKWVLQTFAPQLEALGPSECKRRTAQYVAVCDVYVWKLLRRDMKLGVAETEAALIEMLEGLEGEGRG
jgi:AcrR family transcriptional regulator